MPTHTFVSNASPFSSQVFLWLTFSMALLLLAANDVQGQNKDQWRDSETSQSFKGLLPDRLGEDWRAVGPARALNSAQFATLPDAEVYSEYGLQKILTRVYANGKARATVEIFELEFIAGAFGIFTFNRERLQASQHQFHEGRYLVKISSNHAATPPDQSLIEAIKPNLIGEAGQFPFLPSHLPEQDRIRDSEKYIVGPMALASLKNFGNLKEIVNFEGGVEMVTADYRNGDGQMSLIIIEYHTPQSASEGHAQIQNYFNALPQREKERQMLRRIGNYVVKAVNVRDPAAAENLIGQIKYEAKVYWAGRKLSDIPLEFRPPDPVAIEEVMRTAQVLVRSFYWIGAMLLSAILLGIVAGGAAFYWKRYRRRKLGLDDMFSDAGGTIRLNLDDYLLSSDEAANKQIGKGSD